MSKTTNKPVQKSMPEGVTAIQYICSSVEVFDFINQQKTRDGISRNAWLNLQMNKLMRESKKTTTR